MSITPLDPSTLDQNMPYIAGSDPAANDNYTTLGGQTVDGLAADQDRIRDYIKAFINGAKSLFNDVNINDSDLQQNIIANAGAITALSNSLGDIQSNINDLGNQSDTNTTNISNLTGRVATTENNIIAATNSITGLQNSTQSLSTMLSGFINTFKTGDAFLYGEVNAVNQLPLQTATQGDIYGIGNSANHIGDSVYILAGINWQNYYTIEFYAATSSTLPTPTEQLQVAIVGTTDLYVSSVTSDGSFDWYQQGTLLGWFDSTSGLPMLEAKDNYLLMAKVEDIVTLQSDLPVTAGEHDIYSVDSSGDITASSLYFGYTSGGWVELNYIPGYLLYIYRNGTWVRFGSHDIDVNSFIDWADFGTLEGTDPDRKIVFESGRAELPYSGDLANGTYVVFAYQDTQGGEEYMFMDATPFFNIYEAGSGIELQGNTFSAKVNTAQGFTVTPAEGIGNPKMNAIPGGGTTGQVLVKTSESDYATQWADQTGAVGGSQIAHGVCGDAASTTDKVVTVSPADWQLTDGAVVVVDFYYGHNYIAMKLDVNGSGMINVLPYYNSGSLINNIIDFISIAPHDRVTFIYDGNCWLVASVSPHRPFDDVVLTTNGSTTSFAIPNTYTCTRLTVLLNGVEQLENTDYTWTGFGYGSQTINTTLGYAATSTDKLIVRLWR